MSKRFVITVTGVVVAGALLVGSGVAFSEARGSSAFTATALRAGVVVVRTNLAFEDGAAAGTGIVLSSGEVLTNNHVIRGATTVRVTDVSTHRTYAATVAGYSVAKDVALLELRNAHGLKPASLGTSSDLGMGDRVTAVGNAGGTGALTVSSGTVIGLHRSITVNDDQGGTSRLTDLIETSARLVPGDSGGPLLSRGRVIGVDAATSSGFDFQNGSEGFAIPINTAIAVVKTIEGGHASPSVHIGPTAFLGVSLGQSDGFGQEGTGAPVARVVPGAPADKAGIVSGDSIIRFGGHRVSSPSSLQRLVAQVRPGSAVRVAWLDQAGYVNSAVVRMASGPPQ